MASPIFGLSWNAGGIRKEGSGATFGHWLIQLAGLKEAVFSNLRLSGCANAQPIRVGASKACDNVAFTDVRLTGLDATSATVTAVSFDNATNCGWTGGAILGVPGGSFAVASVTSTCPGCYIENVDFGDSTTNATLPNGAISTVDARLMRLQDNFGSTQASAITFGTPVDVSLSGVGTNEILVGSSSVRVTSTGTLAKINGGSAGDILVLTASGTLTVSRTGGNIKLATATVPLAATDTLTLIFDGSSWLQVSTSDN